MARRSIPFLFGALTIGLLLAILNRDYPFVGFDMSEYVPRFIDTDLHIRINGLVPQWYTPTFGSGLPAFANPQHYQYSLIQLLFLVVGPWNAVLWSTALASAVGFTAFYLFLVEELRLSTVASTLGAIGLIANGFYIQKMAGGQLGFQLFPMLGVFLLVLASRRFTMPVAGILLGLTAAAIVHAGGGLAAVLMAGSLLITIQVVHLLAPPAIDLRRATAIAAIGGGIAVALCASKLYAVQAFMRHFPRTVSDDYAIGFAHALFGLATQLAGGMMIIPVLAAGGFPTQRLDDALIRSTGSAVHVAELDTGLLPVLSIVLAVALVRMIWLAVRGGGIRPSKRQAIEAILVLLTVWIAVETTLAKGFIYPVLHQLPFFRSMHVNHRVAGVFVVPLTVAAVFALNSWRPHRGPIVAALLLTSALAFQATYFLLPEQFFRRWFDITQSEKDHAMVRNGERFPVMRVDNINEPDVFKERSSSRTPYEPLFGYDNETFKADTIAGPVDLVRDDRFNLTNPASLVFPELNGLRPFERIHVSDRENLQRFVNRRQPDWKYPAILDWLNGLALATLTGCLAILARAAIRNR